MKRRFICNRYNGYSIRNHYFIPNATGRGCYFETDDEDVIKLIESVDNYGVDIHPTETIEELQAMGARQPYAKPPPTLTRFEPPPEEEDEPIAVQGQRGTAAGKATRKGDITEKGKK